MLRKVMILFESITFAIEDAYCLDKYYICEIAKSSHFYKNLNIEGLNRYHLGRCPFQES